MGISKKVRQQVYDKYGGLCAYTGKPLDSTWQVDHMTPKEHFTKILHKPCYWVHNITGEEICESEFKARVEAALEDKRVGEYFMYTRVNAIYKPSKECDEIENLFPALRIVNHYKRCADAETFRKFMLTFHIRLAKLPKTTLVEHAVNRIRYMNEVADSFGITIDKPFNGVFYFETVIKAEKSPNQ